MPEGRFTLGGSPIGLTNEVVYRQTALGYDYLGSRIAAVGFGGNGLVCSYHASSPQSRPSGIPAEILTASQVEAKAVALVQPYLKKSTLEVRYYATAKSVALGWLTSAGDLLPRLTYLVEILFNEGSNTGVRGGGSNYYFDAVTGACLDLGAIRESPRERNDTR